MSDFKILQSVHFCDDDDSLYAEFQVTFEYKGRKFIVDHIVAYSGAWNYRVIGYMPKNFERLHGGGMEVLSFEQIQEMDEEPFTEYELIQAAENLMESGESELRWEEEDYGKDVGDIKFNNRGKTDRSITKYIEELFGINR